MSVTGRARRAVGPALVGSLFIAVAVAVALGWDLWAAATSLFARHGGVVALGVAGLALLGFAVHRWRRDEWRGGSLNWWVVLSGFVLVVVVGWVATSSLLREAATANDPSTARIEAIKTGLSIGAGAAGVLALLLAVRRQWHQEITSVDQITDATERRVTELYTKAADQLGSDKASVRLSGFYALERLAQDYPTQRQTIVNVLCAYLRMPYTPPDPKAEDNVERMQEREARLTAQRILVSHLNPGGDQVPDIAYWSGMDLDLTGAILLSFTLAACRVRGAAFANARFHGETSFKDTVFTGEATFTEAEFLDTVDFDRAEFAQPVRMTSAAFHATASFDATTFGKQAWFTSTRFQGSVRFDGAVFTDAARFAQANFAAPARFDGAWFHDVTTFDNTEFLADASFSRAYFQEGADFKATRFTGTSRFDGATFKVDPPDLDKIGAQA